MQMWRVRFEHCSVIAGWGVEQHRTRHHLKIPGAWCQLVPVSSTRSTLPSPPTASSPTLHHVLEVAQVWQQWSFSIPVLQEFSLALPKQVGRWGKEETSCLVPQLLLSYISTCFGGIGTMKWSFIPCGKASGGKLPVLVCRQPAALHCSSWLALLETLLDFPFEVCLTPVSIFTGVRAMRTIAFHSHNGSSLRITSKEKQWR